MRKFLFINALLCCLIPSFIYSQSKKGNKKQESVTVKVECSDTSKERSQKNGMRLQIVMKNNTDICRYVLLPSAFDTTTEVLNASVYTSVSLFKFCDNGCVYELSLQNNKICKGHIFILGPNSVVTIDNFMVAGAEKLPASLLVTEIRSLRIAGDTPEEQFAIDFKTDSIVKATVKEDKTCLVGEAIGRGYKESVNFTVNSKTYTPILYKLSR